MNGTDSSVSLNPVHFNLLNVKQCDGGVNALITLVSEMISAPATRGAFNCGDEQEVIMKKAKALHIRCQNAVWGGRKLRI